jgi:hypothetical protein
MFGHFTSTYMPSARNRYWSAPPAVHNNSMSHGWSETTVFDNPAPTTGAWTPLAVDPSGYLKVSIAGASFSGDLNIENNVSITGQTIPVNVTGLVNSGNYGFFNSSITGSETQIPVGAWSWSVYVESGTAFVNGVNYNTFETVMGGGYDGMKRLSSAINVGCTGSAAAPCRVILNWEA